MSEGLCELPNDGNQYWEPLPRLCERTNGIRRVGSVMCDHNAAKCVDSTEPKAKGRFEEVYECPCGAKGWIRGNEQDPPNKWDRMGEVFQ